MSRYSKNQSLANELETYSSTISKHFCNDVYFNRMLNEHDTLHELTFEMERNLGLASVRELESLKVERDALRANLITMLKKAS